MQIVPVSVLAFVALASTAMAQVEQPDLRIRAQLRTPSNGLWGAQESVGNAEFRVHSRFLQLYYGGVHRNDEFRFTIQMDYRDISGFDTEFAGSAYNANYDAYINNAFVGRVFMGAGADFGLAELQYDSRHPDFPALPLPADFPDPVNAGDTVRIFFADLTLPPIGAPLPSGTPVYQSELQEQYARGDVNQDGHVDLDDYEVLALNYDPYNVVGPHVGPAAGDFTGENQSNLADYTIMAENWDSHDDVPPPPAPIAFCPADFNHDGVGNSADFFDFLTAFFASAPAANINGDAGVDSRDFFDFVVRFFAGCA